MGGPLQTFSYLQVGKSTLLGEGHIMEGPDTGANVGTRQGSGGCGGGRPGAPGARPWLRQGLFFSPPREAGKYTKLTVKIFTQQQFWEEFGMLI